MDLDPAVTRLLIIDPPFSTCRVYREGLYQLVRDNHTDVLKLFNQAAEILLKFKRTTPNTLIALPRKGMCRITPREGFEILQVVDVDVIDGV